MNPLWISAGLTVYDNQSPARAREELAILRAHTITEEGCISFEIRPHQNAPNKFTLWEEWISADALTAHFEAAHTKHYLSLELTHIDYVERLEATL